eukprot:TRINITY_DN11022_c0_g1_i2.p1 TRINITY_DN11022_c0_g1~~TRINITY_DN11022_c0_g1_i2.p1  ORF type:complete len:142 (-),score=10.80 TRINITY_DN11022_c0_g1_i2:40-465(-)
MARCGTLLQCPAIVPVLARLHALHSEIALLMYPCVLTSSFPSLENSKLHTWDPVSVLRRHLVSMQSHIFMLLSAMPPPVASRLLLSGLHASALTAAEWPGKLKRGELWWRFQRKTLLSFPPLASIRPVSYTHLTLPTICSV